jgi:neutral ceramidase
MKAAIHRRDVLKWGLASGSFVATLGGQLLPDVVHAAEQSTLLVGTSRVNMTPTLPTPFDTGILEITDRVTRTPFAKMVYLENGDQRVLLIATDTTGVLHTAYRTFREAIAAKTGLTPGQLIINSSHTHKGLYYNVDDQELLAGTPLQVVGMDSYRTLIQHLADGAAQAIAGKQPARLSVGVGQLQDLAWNRRLQFLSEYHESLFNARRKFPIGTTDSCLGVVRAEGADGRSLAVLCFYACHPTLYEPGLSSDYPGFATAELERQLGEPCVALFFQGCAGNIGPNPKLIGMGGTAASVQVAGTLFAGRVLQTLLTSMEQIESRAFAFGRAEYDLPLVPLSYGPTAVGEGAFWKWFTPPPLVPEHKPGSISDLERRFKKALDGLDRSQIKTNDDTNITYDHWALMALADRLTLARNLKEWSRHEVQVLICGPLCLVFLPGEAFIDYGLEIKQNSPYKYTFVSAYNDTTIQYVPDPIALEEGGYETGPWCYSTPETGGVLVSESLRLIRKMSPGATPKLSSAIT